MARDLLSVCGRGHISVLSVLNLLAAFDTFDHHIRLQRINTIFRLSGTVLGWFHSYLSARTQSVKVHGFAIWRASGFSSLGLPWVLFIADVQPLAPVIRHSGLPYHVYANETWLLNSGLVFQLHRFFTRTKKTLDSAKHWTLSNKLQLNLEKI